MLWLEANAGYFDEYGIDTRINHFLEKISLVSLPQIGERREPEPSASTLPLGRVCRDKKGH